MKILFVSIIIMFVMINTSKSQNQIYKDSLDKTIMVGTFKWADWENEMNWKIDTTFKPNNKEIEKLAELMKRASITFIIFGGSWCGDSKEELPILFEVFNKCKYDLNNVELYGVDRKKWEPKFKFAELNLEKVPTVIVMKNGNEIGRIIEHPEESWTHNLIEIIETH